MFPENSHSAVGWGGGVGRGLKRFNRGQMSPCTQQMFPSSVSEPRSEFSRDTKGTEEIQGKRKSICAYVYVHIYVSVLVLHNESASFFSCDLPQAAPQDHRRRWA